MITQSSRRPKEYAAQDAVGFKDNNANPEELKKNISYDLFSKLGLINAGDDKRQWFRDFLGNNGTDAERLADERFIRNLRRLGPKGDLRLRGILDDKGGNDIGMSIGTENIDRLVNDPDLLRTFMQNLKQSFVEKNNVLKPVNPYTKEKSRGDFGDIANSIISDPSNSMSNFDLEFRYFLFFIVVIF